MCPKRPRIICRVLWSRYHSRGDQEVTKVQVSKNRLIKAQYEDDLYTVRVSDIIGVSESCVEAHSVTLPFNTECAEVEHEGYR
jgi:hypothetical protein